MRVRACVHVYVFAYVKESRMCLFACVCVCVRVFAYVCVCLRMCACVHECLRLQVDVCVCMYVFAYVPRAYLRVCMCLLIY